MTNHFLHESQDFSPSPPSITDSQHTPEKAGDLVPPVELRCQWMNESPVFGANGVTRIGTDWKSVMTKAAAWGADQELKACIEWMKIHLHSGSYLSKQLHAGRRPKPPSLKEQAQAELNRLIALIPAEGAMTMAEPIRRALEALPDEH